MEDFWFDIGIIAAFLGPIIFGISTIIAIFNYPGYTPFANFLSDLGVGQSALFFNSGVIFAGICGIVLANAIYKLLDKEKWIGVLLTLSSIALIGVGVFTEDFGAMHANVSGLFFGLTAISLLLLANVWKDKREALIASGITALSIIGFIALNDKPFLEHLAVATIMLWSIVMGYFLKELKIKV